MRNSLNMRLGGFIVGSLAGGMLVGLGFWLGAVMPSRQTAWRWKETPLYATAAVNSETMAVATGMVDEDVEGLFTLDFLTGELSCNVLSTRIGVFNAIFRTNIVKDLPMNRQKTPQYLLVTGMASFTRGISLTRPGLSVVYVIDANSGNFAAYGVPWRRDFAKSGRPQAGTLTLLDKGSARTAPVRP
jgi:hypothetical protein